MSPVYSFYPSVTWFIVVSITFSECNPRQSRLQGFLRFKSWVIFHGVHASHCLYPSVGLGSFLGCCAHGCSEPPGAAVSLRPRFQFSRGNAHMRNDWIIWLFIFLVLGLEVPPCYFPLLLCHFAFPAAVCKTSSFSASSAIVPFCVCFTNSCSNR